MAAQVIEYDNVGMSPISRCDRCGAQAYVEVQLPSDGPPLLFCANHFRGNAEALKAIDGAMIADHTKFLLAQEGANAH